MSVEQQIEPGPCRPTVDGCDYRFPDTRVMIAHTAIDAGGLTVNRSGKGPIDLLKTQVLAIFFCKIRSRRLIVTTAKCLSPLPVTIATNVFVFP